MIRHSGVIFFVLLLCFSYVIIYLWTPLYGDSPTFTNTSTFLNIPSDKRYNTPFTEEEIFDYTRQYPLEDLYQNQILRRGIKNGRIRILTNKGWLDAIESRTVCIPYTKNVENKCQAKFILSKATQFNSCKMLFDGDRSKQLKSLRYIGQVPQRSGYIDSSNCTSLTGGFILEPLNSKEENFPIAFSILMYKDEQQTRRLLRAIYRPQNFYCIHVDKTSSVKVLASMQILSNCFDNVILSSISYDISWGDFSIVQAEMQCMKDLSKYHWKYFINLTGQEFPLKTNWQIVQILNVFDGGNDVRGSFKKAWDYGYRFQSVYDTKGRIIRKRKKPVPPHGIRIAIGATHIAVTRGYVDFLRTSTVAKDFIEWASTTRVADEMLFSTLNYNPHLGIPGAYTHNPDTDIDRDYIQPSVVRYKLWGDGCPGRTEMQRNICMIGIEMLPRIRDVPHMFANKFQYKKEQILAYDCVEELYFLQVKHEYQNPESQMNTTFYLQLPFVNNHV